MIIRSFLSLILTINVLMLLIWFSEKFVDAHEIKDARLLDLALGDFALRSFSSLRKTGFVYSLHLPAHLFGVQADMVRFRCGSLRRYGANVKEFHIRNGITIHPSLKRVVLVRQDLGLKMSYIYYKSYNISGYQLVSPVLGLLAYDPANLNSTNKLAHEVEILAQRKPITIDFSNVTRFLMTPKGTRHFCASFGDEGKVSIYDQISSNICLSMTLGHFGLVIGTTTLVTSGTTTPVTSSKSGKLSEWKIIIGSSIGGALGVFLFGLLLIALFVKVKKRSCQVIKIDRKAYEQEALQISMVGH